MRSRENPTPAAAEETIRGTQQATEIAVQFAPVRIGAEVHRLVGTAVCGRRSSCILSTLAASSRDAALRPPAGCFVFWSGQTRYPFTQNEKASHCIHYESHLVPSDTNVSYPLNPDSLLGGVRVMIPGGSNILARGDVHRRFHFGGCQRQPAFHFQSDEPEFHHGRSHLGLRLNQLWDGVRRALTAPFCLAGSGHVAFLGAVYKNKPFEASQNRGCR